MDVPVKSIYPLRIWPQRDDDYDCLCTTQRLRRAIMDWKPIVQANGSHIRSFSVFHKAKVFEKSVYNSVGIIAYTWPEMADALADSALKWSIADLQRELDAYLERRRPMTIIFSISVRILPLTENT